jgi:hypothetical protein
MDIDGKKANDLSGGALAMSADGQIIVIGSRLNSDNGTRAGQTRVFALNGTTSILSSRYVQIGGDTYGEAVDDESGVRRWKNYCDRCTK